MTHKCSSHGLIAAPDGRCVICRREEDRSDEDDSPSSVKSLLWTALAGFLCLAIVVGYWKLTGREAQKVGPSSDLPGQEAVVISVPLAQPVPGQTLPADRQGAILDGQAGGPGVPQQQEADEVDANAILLAEKKRVPIRLYSASWCPHCRRAKAFLSKSGYAFEDRDIEASETDKALLRSLNPKGTVPTFEVGGQLLIGFDPQSFDDLLTRVAQARIAASASARR